MQQRKRQNFVPHLPKLSKTVNQHLSMADRVHIGTELSGCMQCRYAFVVHLSPMPSWFYMQWTVV